MNITRNNYEEFFMLYADNELPAAERRTVEAFILANPDLQQELALFDQFKLKPDETTVFEGKEGLLRVENDEAIISLSDFSSFFVLYADGELDNDQKARVENFVYQHPQLQAEFELLQQVKLIPDASIVFEDKENLYRKEEDDKVVPFRWWRLAVAAMVLLMAGIFWLSLSKKRTQTEFVKNTPAVTNPQQPSFYKKEEQQAVDTSSTTGNHQQPVQEATAVILPVKQNRQTKNTSPVNLVKTVLKKQENKIKHDHDLPQKQDPLTNDDVAVVSDNPLKTTAVAAISKSENKAVINTVMAAAADKSVINQQLVYHSTAGENNTAAAEPAVAMTGDKLEVLNASVNTKNSLRGFFRKASRLVARKNNDSDEDSKHKSILIGGFEIAVR